MVLICELDMFRLYPIGIDSLNKIEYIGKKGKSF